MIKAIGMGVQTGDITQSGVEAIQCADVVVVKTALTATYPFFKKIEHITLDSLFESAEDFDKLNDSIVERLKELSADGKNVAYCVSGDAGEDGSVKALADALDIDIISGLSFASALLKNCVSVSYVVIAAADYKEFAYSSKLPLLIKEIDSALLASELKLKLAEYIDENTEILISSVRGIETLKLFELDRLKKYDYSTCCLIQPKAFAKRKRFTFDDLVDIMHALRAPNGCPWDKAQTHESIRANLIEECYELVEGIDQKDSDMMCEEAGDVLLQTIFHAVIGEDMGEFSVQDMVSGLCNKLVGRHTHIFGSDIAHDPAEALRAWERAKGVEKGYSAIGDKMKGVSRALPALMRADKVQKVAVKAGFEWKNIDGTFDKLAEEIDEVRAADTPDKALDECGDLLFACLNVLRFKGVEPERALTFATDKFVRRYARMEELAKADGKELSKLKVDGQQVYWDRVKAEERA